MRFSQVYLCCFGWFCVEYLYFEDVHTFTYDIFAGEIRAGAFLFCVVHHVVFSSSHYCELHNNRPKTAETSAIRVS
jgi:hypothetical protein